MWYRTEFDLNVLFIDVRTRKVPFNAVVFTLRSKVDLIWTRAIRPVIAQSAQFSKIAFIQLHFNNVASDALFHGGHFVLDSRRYAVQTKRITLNHIQIHSPAP